MAEHTSTVTAPRGRVLIAAGGTGGHIFPALAVADCLRRDGLQVDFAGTPQGMETKIVPARGYRLHCLNMRGLRGKGLGGWLLLPWRLGRALLEARRILRACGSQVVLGMGGYASAPVGLAAWTLGRPLCLHEQNAVAGLSNRLLAPLARRIFLGFPHSPWPRAEWVGNPVRPEIAALPPPQQRMATRTGKRRLLVLGGSRGAKVLNAIVVAALAGLEEGERPEIWHQSGAEHLENTRRAYAEACVVARVDAFIEDMAEALAWADLAICRAGAATVAELAAAGLGALLVPYPYAVDDHQAANAQFLEHAGAGRMLRQEDLDGDSLRSILTPLLADTALLQRWAEAARAQARTDAAQRVAAACEELCRA